MRDVAARRRNEGFQMHGFEILKHLAEMDLVLLEVLNIIVFGDWHDGKCGLQRLHIRLPDA